MRISDWSSDVCSSDLYPSKTVAGTSSTTDYEQFLLDDKGNITERRLRGYASDTAQKIGYTYDDLDRVTHKNLPGSELDIDYAYDNLGRSEEHTSELQSLMRISYAVFCLTKKKQIKQNKT